MESPYSRVGIDRWLEVTRKLVEQHPLSRSDIVEIVLDSWRSIFESNLGNRGFRIGTDIFPKPQIMGFLLHE